ncbi:MAG: adenylosuccinate synthase [Thermoplasmata archaeon]
MVIGAQFGDEAKGKITDYLSADARYVVRTGGGPNAGHSIHLPEASLVLHQLSVGVLRKGVVGISGPGMVIDPTAFEHELEDLSARHLLKGEPIISERAHVILPVHQIEDAWEEEVRAAHARGTTVGTTLRGIGPAYSDRYGRWGIRFADLTRPAWLKERVDLLYATKAHLTNAAPKEELTERLIEIGGRLAPYIQATEPILWDAIERGDNILLEGAQSALLDVDFGTYPYVTSSHPTSAGALIGSGIPPQELDSVIGISKAYATRVGTGPFPTEEKGEMGEYLQRQGGERGATTGRTRRTGWLDLVLLRYVARLNGFSSWAVTKVDVLGGLEEVPICTQYVGPDRTTFRDYPPVLAEDFDRVQPVYEKLPGWPEFTSRLKERIRREGVAALPSTLRRFLDFLTAETRVPVELVSYGPQREETVRLPITGPVGSRRGPRPWSS